MEVQGKIKVGPNFEHVIREETSRGKEVVVLEETHRTLSFVCEEDKVATKQGLGQASGLPSTSGGNTHVNLKGSCMDKEVVVSEETGRKSSFEC